MCSRSRKDSAATAHLLVLEGLTAADVDGSGHTLCGECRSSCSMPLETVGGLWVRGCPASCSSGVVVGAESVDAIQADGVGGVVVGIELVVVELCVHAADGE